MPNLDFLKKKIAEKKGYGKKPELNELKGIEEDSIDMSKVDQIVKKMKKKYRNEGLELGEGDEKLNELRGIIAEGTAAPLEVQSIEDLGEAKSPVVKSVGNIFLSLRGIFEPIAKLVSKMPFNERLSYYLFSANMKYSAKQYLALAVTGAAIVFFVTLALLSIAMAFLVMPLAFKIAFVPLVSFAMFIFALIIILLVPKQRAKARGDAISIELPFALRHMATELRAGIGLYRTIQAIATAGYGVLSEEFARAITEIEEGTDTKDALRHLALRTQSKALRSALLHIIRALKTGGNLSEIMNDIAEDVSFELRMKTKDFAAKMNFFGVIFIFTAIVMPVIVAILGGIRNSPISEASGVGLKDLLPLSPEVIAGIYLILMPALLLFFIFYIKMSQPKV